MIVVRDIFKLQFGKAREAKALWKEGTGILKKSGMGDYRVLVDLVGDFYTLIVESTYKDLTAYEKAMSSNLGTEDFEVWYSKFKPLVHSGRREIFTVVE